MRKHFYFLLFLFLSCNITRQNITVIRNTPCLDDNQWRLHYIVKNDSLYFIHNRVYMTIPKDSGTVIFHVDSLYSLEGKIIYKDDIDSLFIYLPISNKYDKYFDEFGSKLVINNLQMNHHNVANLDAGLNLGDEHVVFLYAISIIEKYKCSIDSLRLGGKGIEDTYKMVFYRQ